MAEEGDEQDKKKSHRVRQAGVKAQKKQLKAKKETETRSGVEVLTARQRNPKAFAISSLQKAERNFRRKEDLTAKKQHVPIADQTPQEPPPVLIGVVGPAKVGKTTLIKDLIKNFTRTKVSNISGPITVVTSKKRRITLLECNNDINSMIDIAKCADLVLLLCDASYGFEMEIFEFLNICQVHGMPKIMGILTHLDQIRNAKQMRKRKKDLKHRFWTEVYNGAKLFYLSGLVHGEYLRNEIKNLGRFISVMKFRPLQWRGAHSYLVVDRVEDVTNTELVRQNPKIDREVVLYGYVRGVPLKKELMMHIAGLGDMRIDELSAISDPCPMPGTEKKRSLLEKERLLYAPMSGVGGIVYDKDAVYIELQGSHSHKEKNEETEEQDDLLGKLIEKKQTVDTQIQEQEFKLFSNSMPIKSKDFTQIIEADDRDDSDEGDDDGDGNSGESDEDDDDGDGNSGESDEDDDDSDGEDESESGSEDKEIRENRSKKEKFGWRNNFDENEEEHKSGEEEDSADDEYQNVEDFEKASGEHCSDESDAEDAVLANSLSWKDNLAQKARDAFLERHSTSRNVMRLVYGCYNKNSRERNKDDDDDADSADGNESGDELGGLFKVVAKKQSQISKDKDARDKVESCFFEDMSGVTRDWLEASNKELLQSCFVTGKWKASEDAETLLRLDAMSDAESEVYGDFEDLETGETHRAKQKAKIENENDNGAEEDQDTTKTIGNIATKRKMTRVEEENLTKAEIMAKKLKLKAKFDADYDDKETKEENGRIVGDHSYYEGLKAEAEKQSTLNKSEFENLDEDLRLQIEGYRAGLYVRLGFKHMPSEFIENFDPSYPVLVGALNMAEENIGYVNCKVKKHRWYKRILKTGDPLIISMGWRRFQTIPVYAMIDDNMRHRYLKYTPEHITCSMTFWGPITPQGTGFLALQSVRYDLEEIRRLGFRIAATGCVTELDKSTQIMKKLKLVGYPFKIYKKTAFIKGMFNTTLEVAKFEGAKIKTVSGIRGQIKKAHHTPEGSFRATFEDKILLSDIVFCRTWYRVELQRFYATVTTLLMPPDQKTQWQCMKTLGQLKRERGIRNEPQIDSLYTEIKREPKALKKLVIPKALQRALPYKDKPKKSATSKSSAEEERVAVINSPYEQKVAKMMRMLQTNYRDKKKRQKVETRQRLKNFKVVKKAEAEHKNKHEKELRKKVSRAISKMRKKQNTR